MKISKKIPFILSLCILALCIGLKTSNHPIIEKLQFIVFDSYQIYKPREYQSLPIKIIDIDEESLKKLGQWPWPRSTMAKLVDKLTATGAASIAFDIVFAETDRTSPSQIIPVWEKNNGIKLSLPDLPDHDELFAQSISRSNVVTSFVLTPGDKSDLPALKSSAAILGDMNVSPESYLTTYSSAIPSLAMFENAAAGNGAINGSQDNDGVIRRMALFRQIASEAGKFFPSLMAESLRVSQGASNYLLYMGGTNNKSIGFAGNTYGVTSVKVGDFIIPTLSDSSYWIYYTGHRPERYIPAWKVLEDDFDASQVAGNILLVGTSAIGLKDIRSTPLSKAANGVEVHVQALEQILTKEFLQRSDFIISLELVFTILSALLVFIITMRFSALWGAFFTFVLFAFAIATAWYSFVELKFLIEPVIPCITIMLIYLAISISKHISAENEKRQVRKAFQQYMSPALVEKLAENPDRLTLGGETKDLSILFCDIRGFTTISEQFDAHELINFITRFLTPMTDIIMEHEGTIDKYMGDCIMAFWNAPLDDEEHAYHACVSALEMMQELAVLNITLEKEAKASKQTFIPISVGIGINSGSCCVGNMGSEQRFDYSVVGDDVNLAARLEGQSKTYGLPIVIGEKTAKQIPHFATIELDNIRVKGKTEAVTVYGLLGDDVFGASDEFMALNDSWNSVLASYKKQSWDDAIAQISALLTDDEIDTSEISGLLSLYKTRAECFKENPPKDGWDGVYVATSK
jgi:adenylate cyclase